MSAGLVGGSTILPPLCIINPYAPSAIFILGHPAPRASFRKHYVVLLTLIFNGQFWCHMKNDLASVFGHIFLNKIWKIQKLAYSWECPLSFYAITRAFSRSGSVRSFALFRAMGEKGPSCAQVAQTHWPLPEAQTYRHTWPLSPMCKIRKAIHTAQVSSSPSL